MQSCDRRLMDPNRTAHHLGFPGPSPVCAYIAGPCSLRSTFTLFFLGSGLDGAYSSQSMKGASPRPLWIQGLCTTCQVQSCPHAVTRASCGQPNPFSPGPHGEDARWAWGSKPCESKTVCGHLLQMYHSWSAPSGWNPVLCPGWDYLPSPPASLLSPLPRRPNLGARTVLRGTLLTFASLFCSDQGQSGQ